MKSRRNSFIIIFAIVIVVSLLFVLNPGLFPDWTHTVGSAAPTTHSNEIPKNGENQKSHTRTDRGKGGQKPRDSRLNILFNNDDFTISSLKLDDYLDRVGRNDKSLTAAFLLSGDSLFLKELRNFPDSPLALALIAREGGGTEEAKAAAQRLAELFPENPQGHYWSACFAVEDGNYDAAVSSLEELNELSGSLDVIDGSVTDEMLGALGSLGYDKAESFAYLYHRAQWFQSFQSSTRDLASRLATSLRDLPEEAQAERAAAVIGLFQRVGDTQREAQPLTAMSQMANERSVLKMLPPDFGYGDSGTVSDRLAELGLRIRDESQMMKLEMPALQHAEPKVVDEYFAVFQKDGFAAAREWLLMQQ